MITVVGSSLSSSASPFSLLVHSPDPLKTLLGLGLERVGDFVVVLGNVRDTFTDKLSKLGRHD